MVEKPGSAWLEHEEMPDKRVSTCNCADLGCTYLSDHTSLSDFKADLEEIKW